MAIQGTNIPLSKEPIYIEQNIYIYRNKRNKGNYRSTKYILPTTCVN